MTRAGFPLHDNNTMMIVRFTTLTFTLALLILPAVLVKGQFGVAGRRRPGTNFQELQELAKKQAAGVAGGAGDLDEAAQMEEMAKLWTQLLDDPDQASHYAELGAQFADAMEQLRHMEPEQLQKQMDEVYKVLTEGSLIDTILERKEDVLKNLEATGAVPPEELAKLRADPEYFDSRMKESFGSMQELMKDPEYVKKAQSMMKMLTNPESYHSMFDMLKDYMDDDEKIEEVRQQMLSGALDENAAVMKALGTQDLAEILQDPVKWREAVREGYKSLMDSDFTAEKDDLPSPTSNQQHGFDDEL